MISIEDLSVAFGGVTAIDRLTVDLDGDVVGLIGPNGAGKTTLLNVLSGFTRPKLGRVLVDGIDQQKLTPAARARAGLRRTFQTELVVDELTVWDNVLIAAENTMGRAGSPLDAVERVLDLTMLGNRSRELVGSLDSFERRLVEVARAAVGAPTHILLDEPGAGLGIEETGRLQDLIADLQAGLDVQIVLVDHDVELIRATCDTAVCLDFGVLIAAGRTADVLDSTSVREAYLGVDTSGAL